jgi:RNA polymerase sigma-54 factor
MLETEQDPAVQKYLREKLRQVEQVLHDLGNRKSTMLRCGKLLARHQQAFFQGGSLKKLTLRDAAQELEVHESTVSRTVKDKYIQCDRGLFPMSYFFSRSAGQNPNLCRDNIQEALSQVIAAEDTRHPLSDQQLVSLLSKEHIIISRRTVAKYRSELGILPASARKCAGL